MTLFLLLTLASAAASFTLSRGVVFQGVRDVILRRGPLWLGRLVMCPYCTLHWVALGVVLAYRPRVLSVPSVLHPALELVGTWLALVGASALVLGLYARLLDHDKSSG